MEKLQTPDHTAWLRGFNPRHYVFVRYELLPDADDDDGLLCVDSTRPLSLDGLLPGQVSMGQAGFFALGGYTSAFLTTLNLADYSAAPFVKFLSSIGLLVSGQNLYEETTLYLSPWIAFIAAILMSVLVAYLIGIPVLKLKGHYLVMATMSISVVIEVLSFGEPGYSAGRTGCPVFLIFR